MADLVDQLAAVFKATEDNPEGAYTTRELGAALGLSRNAVLQRLHAMNEEGRIKHVRVKRLSGLNNSERTVDAYILIEGNKDGEKEEAGKKKASRKKGY